MNNKEMLVAQTLETFAEIEVIDKCIAQEFSPLDELTNEEAVIWAGVLAYLSFMQRNGHSCLHLPHIASSHCFNGGSADKAKHGSQCADHVESTDIGELDPLKTNMVLEGIVFPPLTPLLKIVKKALENDVVAALFVYHNGKLYSRRYYEFEQEVAQNIVKRTTFEPLTSSATEKLKALWPRIFPTDTAELPDWQQVAVAKSLVQRFSVINGGPGTGKTYTVLRLLLALQACDDNLNIVLAAPTGKAQQRMTESILSNIEGLRGAVDDSVLDRVPTQAVTIHRLLGLREYSVTTRYNRQNPLDLDVLIVDEASMVDLALMTRITRALPEHARLYFIGDADQLPAVELGNVLEQLVDDDEDSPHSLGTERPSMLGAVPANMRQHVATLCPHLPLLPANERAKSWVSTLQAPQRFKGQVANVATAIQQGNVDSAFKAMSQEAIASAGEKQTETALTTGVKRWDENNVSTSQLLQLAKLSYGSIFDAGSVDEAFAQLNKVRWLTPVRQGAFGVESLNGLVFNAIKQKIRRREGQFYQGQPIMIVKNHHPLRLSNGEVGIIWPDHEGKLYAWFEEKEGQLRRISLSRIPQFETVYAMTIHKSQGSEFEHVVLLLPRPETEKAAGLFHRGLVYTGLTRAREGCLIIANSTTFAEMVKRIDRRFSGLSEAISHYAEVASIPR
ncbi:exodeoxyribonuclease V subunit alpha [Alteromonas sp. D210916BOD_24]|uniref:exodeoxyribonuclease V subunit alpha n=1 Tax=Alteromonas sp. D210916BOD_24 TaxID=3157618 RepID=UPI00399D0498